MKNKKLNMYIGIILLILIIWGIGYLVYVNINNEEDKEEFFEYTPQEEISDEELRKTVVSLYFLDIQTADLVEEPRQIDSKELLNNPYIKLVELLIEGPKDGTKAKLIPEGTRINSAELRGNTVYLDFSEEFVKDGSFGEEQEKKIINSIVNTLTELTEVNSVKINIAGNEASGFSDNAVIFDKLFTKEM